MIFGVPSIARESWIFPGRCRCHMESGGSWILSEIGDGQHRCCHGCSFQYLWNLEDYTAFQTFFLYVASYHLSPIPFIWAFWTLFSLVHFRKKILFFWVADFFRVFILTDDTGNHKESSWELDFWGDAWKVKSLCLLGVTYTYDVGRQICFFWKGFKTYQ